MRAIDDIDAEVHPAPDIVIEVDVSRSSKKKLDLFARFQVPEVWRVADGRVRVYELVGPGYVERGRSVAIPILTAEAMARLIAAGRSTDRLSWVDEIRAWVREQTQTEPTKPVRHRIRGAAVVVHEGRLLLARHDDRKRGLSWWSPPGGGVEGEEGILAAAAREAEEETSLRVVHHRPIYGQELIDRRRNNRTLEYFVLCELAAGVSPDDLRAANEIAEVRWVDRAATIGLPILPTVFATEFWDDLAAGFPTFRHLGLNVIGEGAEPA